MGKSISREINGTEYTVNRLSFDHWEDLTEFLSSMVGGPMGQALMGDVAIRSSLLNADVGLAILGTMVGSITAANMRKFRGFMGRCLTAQSDGTVVLDSKRQSSWWPDHLADLPEAVSLFLEVQYADFFGSLKRLAPETETEPNDPSEKGSDG